MPPSPDNTKNRPRSAQDPKAHNDIHYPHLKYRAGVGIMLFNADGHIFVGERIDHPGQWQMPQGGIDENEDIIETALREMEEEIGTRNARFLAEMEDWVFYDLPERLIQKLWNSEFRGQKQKWLAFEFTGVDADIRLDAFSHPEFRAWKWVPIEQLLDFVVPFKRGVYEKALQHFSKYEKDRR